MNKLDELIQQLCPDGVEWVKLEDIGVFENVGIDKKTIPGQPLVSLLNYVDVYKNIYIDNSIPQMIVSSPINKIKACSCEKGDIFITPTSETKDDIGHASVITETLENTVYSYHIMRFRLADINMTTSFYIRYLFDADILKKQIYKLAKGLTRYGLSKNDFAKIEIPLPSLPVQEEIVRILDTFTESTNNLKEQIQTRRKQYEYYRNQLLTFDTSRTDVEWEALNDCCVVQRGIRVVKKNLMEEGTVPVFQNSIAPMGYYDKSNYPANVSYIICAGSSSGSIGFCTVPFWAADDCLCVLSKGDIDNKFIYYYLQAQHSYIKTKVRGGAMPRLSRQVVDNLKFPIPPLTEQKRIVNILDQFEASITNLELQLKQREKQYEYYRNQLLDFKKKKE